MSPASGQSSVAWTVVLNSASVGNYKSGEARGRDHTAHLFGTFGGEGTAGEEGAQPSLTKGLGGKWLIVISDDI